MKNQRILEELNAGREGHIIFSGQEPGDLDELAKVLTEKGELVVSFSKDEWEKHSILFIMKV